MGACPPGNCDPATGDQGPIDLSLGFPLDTVFLDSPRGYLPCPNPDDPTRLEDQAPWAPGDPRRERQSLRPVEGTAPFGDYSMTAPDARPQDCEDFYVNSGLVILLAATRTLMCALQLDSQRGGRLLEIWGQSMIAGDLLANNPGLDIVWELVVNGSQLPRRVLGAGALAPYHAPKKLVVQLPENGLLQLFATRLGGGVTQAVISGLTYPRQRGRGLVAPGLIVP